MRFARLVLVALQVQACAAVKHWMFKRCDQNPFCDRNRDYAANAEAVSENYVVDGSSIDYSNPAQITGTVLKHITPSEAEVAVGSTDGVVRLPFTLEITTDKVMHLLIDEAGRQLKIDDKELEKKLETARFGPSEYMLDQTQSAARKPSVNPKITNKDENGFSLDFGGSNTALIEFKPFRVSVQHNGETQVVLNKYGFLNYEHLRRKRDGERNANWEDRFDKWTDVRVRGPESVAMDTSFVGYDHIYGIPEHADALSLRDTTGKEPYRLFNVDIFEYETSSPMSMYGAVPYIVGQRPGHAAGVFWLNAADTYIDIAKSSEDARAHWMSETGKLDIYVILGETPAEVLASYGELTGKSMLPQQFTLGYHQCRWNYMSQPELLGVNTKMDEYEMPYDVIWLDIEWTDDRRYFAWNKEAFPDPEGMMDTLDETRRKLVVLNDPHIKAVPSYPVYADLKDHSLAILDDRGTNPFQAHCWPGQSIWIDGFHPEASEHWEKFHALGTELGGFAENIHIWSDMSEPSVFSGSETTAYKNTLHHGGWQHRDVHNLYGQTVANITYDAMYERYGGRQRPFILTRSFFAGTQRLAAMWTGDNQAEWEYLQAATPMVLTLGVSGIPFSGADVGGFFRNPSDELLVRWYQAGVFYPFFRAHAHIESKYREPYLLEGDWQIATRNALELRYQLLPQIYTAFWDASQVLTPVMRPLFWDAPTNEALYDIDDQFFLGPALMAKPIVSPAVSSVSIVVPDSEIYYDYFTGEAHSGSPTIETSDVTIHTIPLYVKGGSIVFRKDRPRRSSELMKHDPYTLLIATGKNGTASGHLYVDDGVSFEYSVSDDFVVLDVDFDGSSITGSVRHRGKGPFKDLKIERIIVYTSSEVSSAETKGKVIDVIQNESGYILRNPQVPIGENWEIKLH